MLHKEFNSHFLVCENALKDNHQINNSRNGVRGTNAGDQLFKRVQVSKVGGSDPGSDLNRFLRVTALTKARKLKCSQVQRP